MTVLVTGGAGFIGSHIAAHFQGKAQVRVLDNFHSGRERNLEGLDAELFRGSICDRDLVRRAVRDADLVFHLAALISVPESMRKPVEYTRVNTIGTLVVLEEAAAAGVRKLCFSSSAAVYGDNPQTPKSENMQPEPRSPYAITKLSGEYSCALFTREGRLPTACLRYFNVFGPRQDPASPYAAAVPIFLAKALAGDPLDVFGDGEQTRDFVYVKDVVAANVHAATHDITGTVNVAYGGALTVNSLAHTVVRLTGSSSPIRHLPERPGDIRHSVASVARLRATGCAPEYTFEQGLLETVRAYATEYAGEHGRKSAGPGDG
ncbi:MAG: NAD-dependent epimerase/dehydratase family protein [Lentisphaeria bacterium]|nr:NAD-dependent epimerase/dehydratase family protein [Lentisphaeria bacterium]